jgi:uncharacterized protein with HEPN domain
LPGDLKSRHSEVDWRRIAGMRDVLIHSYFQVDLELVWKVLEDDLPVLKEQILKVKDEELDTQDE